MTKVNTVAEPRSPLTDAEKEEIDFNGHAHEIGVTRKGGTPVAKTGSQWRIIGRNGSATGSGFHSINEYMTIQGVQLYVGEGGAMIYILDENGNEISDGHHSIEHLSGGDFKGQTGASEETFTIHL